LLRSTDIGTLFLDQNLRIRKFTPAIAEVFHILPQDIGRPVEHIAAHILYDGLLEQLQLVLQKGVPLQTEVQNRQGKWFLMRILPYYTEAHEHTGVVLTFVDIMEQKGTSAALQRQSTLTHLLQSIASAANESSSGSEAFRFTIEQVCAHLGWQIGHVYFV